MCEFFIAIETSLVSRIFHCRLCLGAENWVLRRERGGRRGREGIYKGEGVELVFEIRRLNNLVFGRNNLV